MFGIFFASGTLHVSETKRDASTRRIFFVCDLTKVLFMFSFENILISIFIFTFGMSVGVIITVARFQ